jgi:hypothetical protein
MKTSRSLVVLVVGLVILLVANIIYTVIRTSGQDAQKGDQRTQQPETIVRVKDEDEQRRMEQYIADYYQPLKVVQTLDAPLGELIDCVDINTQPALDPVNDLLPVCPNCHAMLHFQNPPLSPEQLRRKINQCC